MTAQDETPLSDMAARVGADQAVRDLLAARDALRGWVMHPTGPGAPKLLDTPSIPEKLAKATA